MGVVAQQGLSHVSFPVQDLARSLRFYQGLLGLEPVARPNLPLPGAWLRAGDAQVHLIVPPEGAPLGAPPPSLNPLAGHVAFAIDDYASVVTALRAAGLEILEAGNEVGQLWIRDPDGHLIELIRARVQPR